VTVTDQGGLWAGSAPDDYPHGLEAVALMAGSLSIDGGDDECAVRFTLPWQPHDI
jgi:hypothetical protein